MNRYQFIVAKQYSMRDLVQFFQEMLKKLDSKKDKKKGSDRPAQHDSESDS